MNEELLENPPSYAVAVANLATWSTNYNFQDNPLNFFLDMTGLSTDIWGSDIFEATSGFSGFGYVELYCIGNALVEYTDRPMDVGRFVEDLFRQKEEE